ncbi:unnamed protein product [Calicophoron daubneyi]|uniref:IRS-type PTB domain-containing protein n=1 Tax=Calicophoron daubneyi TaxID=300641 RepID=A0AAV2TCQ1_CALDB
MEHLDSRVTAFLGFGKLCKFRVFRYLEITCKPDFSSAFLIIYTPKSRWNLDTSFRRPCYPKQFPNAFGRTGENPSCLSKDKMVRMRVCTQPLDDLFHVTMSREESEYSEQSVWFCFKSASLRGPLASNLTVSGRGSCEEKLLHEQAFSYQSCTAVDESSKPLNSGALPQMYSQCDLRDKHILSLELLMESGKTIHLQFDSKTIFDRCLHTIRSVIAYNKRSRGYPDLVHAWPVSVKHRTRNHSSSRFLPTSRVKQYLCLTPSEVLLTHGCLRTPTLVSSYSHIRECSSRMDGRFSLNLGRASPVGECVLILRLANGTQAAFAHKVLFKLMRQFSALHRSGHNDGCIDGTQSEYNSFSLLPLPPLVTADLPQTADRDEPENKARRNGSHCPGDLESKWVGNNCEALGPIFLTWPRRSQDHLSVDVGRKPVQRAVTNPEMRNIEMIPSSNVQSFNHASGGKVRNSELLEAHYLQMDCPNEDTAQPAPSIVRAGSTKTASCLNECDPPHCDERYPCSGTA